MNPIPSPFPSKKKGSYHVKKKLDFVPQHVIFFFQCGDTLFQYGWLIPTAFHGRVAKIYDS